LHLFFLEGLSEIWSKMYIGREKICYSYQILIKF